MDQLVQPLPFPIVGIGASAGGLEALEEFFRHVPPEPGMAFVVVQHLSPQHHSLLAQILARYTAMPVQQITHGMPVEVNQAYVIAPAFTLTLSGGKLQLGELVEERGQRRPVDDFLRSLAEEQGERAVAVILSGTGTNGTAGAQAIKVAGGICLAQSPESAAFPGMPQSLIHAGFADEVLEPAAMAEALIDYFTHSKAATASRADETSVDDEQPDLSDVHAILRARTRHDFSGYRKSTLLRRVQRRMGLVGLTQLSDYAALMMEQVDEVTALANDLMINVTGFFRDPEAWEALRASVIDPLCRSKVEGEPIRVWVTACASGEEAYTLAICFAEAFRDRRCDALDIKIFATDMADRPLTLARAGVYPGGIEGDVPAELLERYFSKDEYTYRVRKFVREMVVFAPHDILRDPPFSRIDLCTCRNLLIYLEPETQRRVIPMLHFALRTGGFLFLGNTESVGDDSQFEMISHRWRIYRKTGVGYASFSNVPGLPPRAAHRTAVSRPDTDERPAGILLLQRALLERYGPPTVVVDRAAQIVYFHGATDPYLRQPAGEPTRDLLQLVRPVLRVIVQGLLRAAVRDNRPHSSQVELADSSTGARRLEMTAAPVIQSRDPDYFLISFRIVPVESSVGARVDVNAPLPDQSSVYDELRMLRSELQNTVEAYEATSEELKAANEEATSVNEELQSANEELTTSKEELQAVNEELVTVNSQLQGKILQLESTTNDLVNLLSSTNIAVLFLDRELRVRRFTPRVTDLLRLIESDIGRPVTDIALKFNDDTLLEDARSVLADLAPAERTVTSHAGRRYLRRILPYRTTEHRVEGVVTTFIDVQ